MTRGDAHRRFRLTVVSSIVSICVAFTYRCHFLLGTDVAFSHLYYVPIALTGVWWGLAAVPMAVILSLYMLASRSVADLGPPTSEDLLRCLAFVMVGLAVGLTVRQKNRLEAEAVQMHRDNLRQMSDHVRYMARVSHELRNPLQVILGVMDSLPAQESAERRAHLLRLVDRSAESMRARLQELSHD
jgi:signal transduction histidine kinase